MNTSMVRTMSIAISTGIISSNLGYGAFSTQWLLISVIPIILSAIPDRIGA